MYKFLRDATWPFAVNMLSVRFSSSKMSMFIIKAKWMAIATFDSSQLVAAVDDVGWQVLISQGIFKGTRHIYKNAWTISIISTH